MGVSVLSGTAKGATHRSTKGSIRFPAWSLLFRLLPDRQDVL